MDAPTLTLARRPANVRAAHIRSNRMIPGIVYGRGLENIEVQVDYQTFRRIFEKATFNTIVTLEIGGVARPAVRSEVASKGGHVAKDSEAEISKKLSAEESAVPIGEEKKQIPVLIHDVQYHPVSEMMEHIDFYALRMDEKIETRVMLEFIGASEAVKSGAILNTNRHNIRVSCLPKDLIHGIQVDISVLKKIGDIIRVSDLRVPEGVEILSAPQDPVVSAIELKIVVEETPVETVAAAPSDGAAPAAGAEGAAAPGAEAGKEGVKKEETTEKKPGGKEKKEGAREKKK